MNFYVLLIMANADTVVIDRRSFISASLAALVCPPSNLISQDPVDEQKRLLQGDIICQSVIEQVAENCIKLEKEGRIGSGVIV
jgi:hypothetical protein